MKKIKKCVIPAAGMGTRFLPATKALPKEMFPIVDKPVMQYLIEEAIAAWCEDIIIVTWRSKRAIEDYFDSNPELEQRLDDSGKFDYLKKVTSVSWSANIVYVRQPYPLWDGDAILRVKNLIGDEPFLVLFGDDIIDNPISAAEQLVKTYEKHNKIIIASIEVLPSEIKNYWIIETDKNFKVKKFIEKPNHWETISCRAAIGKYILTPDIFQYLKSTKSKTSDQEIRLADAFIDMLQDTSMYALNIIWDRYDTGSKIGYLKACVAYAMKDTSIQSDLKIFLEKYLKNN